MRLRELCALLALVTLPCNAAKKTDSAEDCWLDCLWKHVNDEWNDANLVAIDWYPDSKKCWCQDACKYLHETNKDVVVIVRGEALSSGAKEACGG